MNPTTMDFGAAIRAMKQGKRVARTGWNGKDMYLWLLPAAHVKAEWCKEPLLKELAEQNGGEVECLGSVRMKTADGKVLTGWLASQADMLAEDWVIVEAGDTPERDIIRVEAGVRYPEDGHIGGERDDNNDEI